MPSRTEWFKAARWGLMFHYLASPASSRDPSPLTAEEWNRRVDSFDVPGLAAQVAGTGAGYVLFTLGQNSGHYCSPNATYDRLSGVSPSKCSRRDLPGEIADALRPHGVRLLAYLPSHAPAQDPAACVGLRCTPPWDAKAWGFGEPLPGSESTDERLTEFQWNWEAVIREWSLRWGDRVSGWWFDGCYHADRMYRHADALNFASFAAAARAGNLDSLVAFNPGVKIPIVSVTEHEDYTAGELAGALQVDGYAPGGYGPLRERVLAPGAAADAAGAQLHVLTFAGGYWGRGEPRFPDELLSGYTHTVNACGGVVTWDVPVSDSGVIPRPFIEQLQRL